MIDERQFLNAGPPDSSQTASQLLPLVYAELRRLAKRQLTLENVDHTLDPTGLVHEAYLRLTKNQAETVWAGRGHFYSAAAVAMRRILVEAGRRRRGLKRGGGRRTQALTGQEPATVPPIELWLSVDEALDGLLAIDPLAAQVAQLRIFTGLSVDEAAQALNVSRATAFRAWAYARAFLKLQLPNLQNNRE